MNNLNIATTFDWRTIAKQSKPDVATISTIKELTKTINTWATKFKLPADRVAVSAFAGVCNSPAQQRGLVEITAKFTLWLFVLDNYIDRINYSQFGLGAVTDKMLYLDSGLLEVVKPLYESGKFIDLDLAEYGLEVWHNPSNFLYEQSDEEKEVSLALRCALNDIYSELQNHWSESQELSFNLKNFTIETAAVVAAMRGEMKQSFAYQATAQLPTLTEYLNQSKYSICLRASGAVAVSFDPKPLDVWQQAIPSMDLGAKVLRLVNDLATIEKEVEERKINAVSIVLNELNYPVFTANNKEIKEATVSILTEIQNGMVDFGNKFSKLSPSNLQYNVEKSVANTIAMYQHGDYVEF